MPAPIAPGIPTSNLVLFLQTTDSPVLYNAIANLGDFTGPAQVRTIVDVSKHGDKFFRKVATLIDSGVLATPCWFDPSQPTLAGNPLALAELVQADATPGPDQALQRWLLAFVDDTGTIIAPGVCTFNAYVSKFTWDEPVKGVWKANTELTIDGAVNYLFQTTIMPAGQAIP